MNNLLAQAAATPHADSTTRLISLTKGQFAIVDAADFEWLNQWKWCVTSDKKRHCFYAVRRTWNPLTKRNSYVLMHRLILGLTNPKIEGEHRDLDGLNNRRSNLRACTHQQNRFNTGKRRDNKSGYKGVVWRKRERKWRAVITLNGRRFHLGDFVNIVDAANAYAKAGERLHGEFSRSA